MARFDADDFTGDLALLAITTRNGRVLARPFYAGPLLSKAALMELLSQVEPLEITPYSQNDPRWKDEIYAGGKTFGDAGCLVCCVAMVASLVYDLTPPEIATRLRDAGAFQSALLSRPMRIPDALPMLRWDGPVHFRARRADMAFVKDEIEEHHATIAEVKWDPKNPVNPPDGNQHFVVIRGVTDMDVHIIDPWDGQHKLLTQSRYSLEHWTPARAIYGLRLLRPQL